MKIVRLKRRDKTDMDKYMVLGYLKAQKAACTLKTRCRLLFISARYSGTHYLYMKWGGFLFRLADRKTVFHAQAQQRQIRRACNQFYALDDVKHAVKLSCGGAAV